MSWADFFAMGGYGIYVWGSYGAAALVLVVNVVAARRRHRSVLRMLRRYAGAGGDGPRVRDTTE